MLKVSHLTITQQQRHLFSDVSFTLGNQGFCTICAKEKEAERKLSYVLAGMHSASSGTVLCDDMEVTPQNIQQQSKYRQGYVTSWFGEFLILPQKTVKENIVLQYAYTDQEIEKALRKWKLSEVADTEMDAIPLFQQAAVMLARLSLRHYRVLIFYPDSTPYSKEELDVIYELLTMCSEQMLVIVIGDERCYSLSDHILEFENGVLISEHTRRGNDALPRTVTNVTASRPKGWEEPFSEEHHRYQWLYHMLKALVLMSLLLICILWSTTSLDVVHIESGMLQKADRNSFAIEKHALGNDQTLYPSQFAAMDATDILKLQEALSGQLSISYMPINTTSANAYLEGIYYEEAIPRQNNIPIMEADNAQKAGVQLLTGSYPTTFDEVAISMSTVNWILRQQESDPKALLQQTISWYGLPLTIVGVYSEETPDMGIQALTMPSQATVYPLYVKTGYLRQHPLSQMLSFPRSYKRMLQGSTFITLQDIQPLSEDARFYDGFEVVSYQQPSSDEIILDLSAAKALGFPYETIAYDENMSYQEKLLRYLAFVNDWIGEPIQIQAYTIASAPLNSTIHQRTYTIKGFLIPSMDMLDGYETVQEPIAYLSASAMKEELVPNVTIQKVIYRGNDVTQLQNALQYLKDSKQYEASLQNSLLLQLFVIDLKDLFFFFSLASAVFLLASAALYFLLMKKTIEHLRTISSISYVFGDRLTIIRKHFEKASLKRWRKYLIASMLVTTILLWVYILLILWKLSADITLLLYLLLPPCVAALLYFSMQLATTLYLKHTHLLHVVLTEDELL